MKQHIHLLGLLFIIYGAMGVLGAGIVFIVMVFGGIIADATSDAGGVTVLTSIVGLAMGLVVFVTNIPALVVGWGLMKYTPWSRIVGLIVGILCLLAFPFGTALGIYAIWVLVKDESVRLLQGQSTVRIDGNK